ncbi:MAG: hypothetical protein V7607_2557 [Solirubrobacteraceae bacterium]
MAIVGSKQAVNGHEVMVLVEVDELPEAVGGWAADRDSPPDGAWPETRSQRAERVMDAARDVFGDGLALARDCAIRTVDSLEHTAENVRPDEFELSLAIKLDAEVGAVLAKATAGAQMQVSMRWSRHRKP